MRSRSIRTTEARTSLFLAALALCLGLVLVSASDTHAATSSPWWSLTANSRPTQLQAGETGEIAVVAQNLGDTPTSGEVKITDELPKGLSAIGIAALAGGTGEGTAGPVSCLLKTLTCTFGSFVNSKKEVVAESLPPYQTIEVRIRVGVHAEAESGEVDTASVSGGGVSRPVSATRPLQVGGEQVFGFEDYKFTPENSDGTVDTQAGSHPFQATNLITLNSQATDASGNPLAVGLPKTVVDELPVGFVGNPTPFAQCTEAQFAKVIETHSTRISECPASAAIGVATLKFSPVSVGFTTSTVPIFNVTPLPGEPARFGFKVAGAISAFLDTSIRSGSDYGVNVTSADITEFASLVSVRLSFWGVPGDPRHDSQRGWECLNGFGSCPPSTVPNPPPFLVMPTECGGSFESTLRGESWGSFAKPTETADPVSFHLPETVDGCNHLPFTPEVKVTPDGSAASTPTGLNVDVHVPQQSVLNSEGLAESAIKDITVALPEGVAVAPSGADGLEACGEGLAGFTGFTSTEPRTATFTSALPSPLQPGSNFCPDGSKIGTVRIATPLLPPGQNVTGSVYLASQNENPFGSLIAMYIIAEDPISGAVVKLPGEVRLTGTGQIVATFKSNPQLAFEDAELHFFGGDRAPLATPSHCGAYTTNGTFTPWSGNEPVNASSTFNITSGPNGSPCPGASLPFDPSLTGGSTSIQAGGFSPLTTTITREDGQQNISQVQLHMPPGLSGLLDGVELCGEAQANAGTCGPNSLIGETIVSVGLGGNPYSVTGGKVYITGPYKGAPFGLSIVNPAKAGPFDLEKGTPCDCVVVRAKLEVDPRSAALTVTTDGSQVGEHPIPTIIDGIPLQIRHVNVTINRAGFTFNPTNCAPTQITGEVTSTEGASKPLAVPFQVTNCATLGFKPGLSSSTGAKTTRQTGASLKVKLTYPKAPFGSQANIKSVKVDLPKQLPSRLSTLQKACTAAQFEANPAGCPAESIVGHATATTPLIPVPLTGPAYFVSYGGAKFPELVIVLQGYGVTLDLHGETFISKAGITSSTFHTVPDAPVGSFELNLPQGKFSALAANANLCTVKGGLKMPTQFVAQNGAIIKQSTPITVSGCARHKTVTAKTGKKAKKGKASKSSHRAAGSATKHQG
jgi:uncharacterized repeat protein (TIGR01451 family)